MKKLLEVHALQNFAPSNLNRDDTGAPKDALFGGTRRARISSQCQKRAVRRMFAAGALLGKDDLGIRTKRLVEEMENELATRGRPEEESREKIHAALAASGLALNRDGTTEYLLFLGRREIRDLAALIDADWNALAADGNADSEQGTKKARKEKAKQGHSKIAGAVGKILNGGKAADVALFGRMLADMPEANQDAACQVAHAISTHAVDREFDFYTAIDDRRPDDSAGAGMMGSLDFNSACFYRYACLDADLLESNLHGDSALAARAVRAFLDAFIRSEPTGRQNSFAAHNPPGFVLVRAAKDAAPLNLANAFESPVRPGRNKSLTALSAESLAAEAVRLRTLYGYEGDTLVLNACGAETPDSLGEAMPSWPALLDRAMALAGGW